MNVNDTAYNAAQRALDKVAVAILKRNVKAACYPSEIELAVAYLEDATCGGSFNKAAAYFNDDRMSA